MTTHSQIIRPSLAARIVAPFLGVAMAATVLFSNFGFAAIPTSSPTVVPSTDRWSNLTDVMFQHLTKANGLSNDAITTVTEDSDGFIWIGSQGNLSRWDGYRFHQYPHNPDDVHSMPHAAIETLFRDRKGQLWVGTNGGALMRYVRQYDHFDRVNMGPDHDNPGAIHSIVDDGADGLWVGTDRGLVHVKADGSVTNLRHDRNNSASIPSDMVPALLYDREGTLWIGTTKGLIILDVNTGNLKAVPVKTATGINPHVLTLAQSSDGKIWIGTENEGAYLINGKGKLPQPLIESGNSNVLNRQSVGRITETKAGEVWLGLWGHGVIIVDSTSIKTKRLRQHTNIPTSLIHNFVTSLYHDRAGIVWVGTTSGLSRTPSGEPPIRALFTAIGERERLHHPSVNSVYAMKDGRIFLGHSRHGVSLIDADASKIALVNSILPEADLATPNSAVQSFAGPINGQLYTSSRYGLFRNDVQHNKVELVKLPTRDVLAKTNTILQDGNKIWLGGNLDGLWMIDATDASRLNAVRAPGTSKLYEEGIFVLHLGKDGAVWIGTRHNGVFRYDPATHALRQLGPNSTDKGALSPGFIASILIDSRGWLWIGSQGGGVNVLKSPNTPGRVDFQKISVAEGRGNNLVSHLLEDNQGRIWATTDSGLTVINPHTLKALALQPPDGAAIQDYRVNSGARTREGELLFGGENGLTVIRPELYKEWTYRPPVVVTEVRAGGQVLPATAFNGPTGSTAKPVEIKADANSMAVEFAALDFSAPDRNLYAYRLDGFDKDWIYTNSMRRTAAYNNLSPGDYRLHLRGSNRNGVWTDEERVVPVSVLPAWYQTWWMRAVDGLMAALAIYALVQGRTRYLRRRHRELETQVGERTFELNSKQFELINVNTELARVNALQEEHRSELTRFLAVASHDLRQPMHALNLYLGALTTFDMAEPAKPVLGSARKCAQIMDDMFLALLDLSRLDAQVVDPLIKPFPVTSLLSSIEIEFTPQAHAKGLSLRVVHCSAWIESDVTLVAQIVRNLVANAVRYTQSGKIVIGCRRRGSSLRIAVIDTGIGIAPEEQKSVFEEFSQVDNAGHDRTKGLGLGLAIVRRLGRLLHASITLTSMVGKGSMFAIDLPRIDQPCHDQNAVVNTVIASDDDAEALNSFAGKLVVVVDDEEGILDAMRILLQQWGCSVVTAVSGDEAIAKLGDSKRVPDVLITDYQLRTTENGLDVIVALQNEFNEDIQSLIITGTLTKERIQEMTLSRMTILHKPVNAVALHDILKRLLLRRKE